MLSIPLTPEQLIFRSITGVRQRVILILLATVLALVTQGGRGGLQPNGAEGDLEISVEIAGEQLRFACQGSGHATVLFLASRGTRNLPGWDDAQDGAAAFARVCTLDMASFGPGLPSLTPAEAERFAADLDGVLAGEQVPAPYVLVAAMELESITASFSELPGGLVNGTLLIDATAQPATGWIIEGGERSRAATLASTDQFLLAIRSLVWPPARMHSP